MTNRITKTFVNQDKFSIKTPCNAYSDDNGKTWRWECNNAVIAVDVCKAYGIPCDPKEQSEATTAYVKEILSHYKPRILTPEELYEMRAAFGEGKKVVNILTGETYLT